MSASRKRPTGPPPSAGVLARYAQAYARELGVAEGRVRAWVAYMIMAGVLDRATNADSPLFIVKGGVALELRLRDRARATKDIDPHDAAATGASEPASWSRSSQNNQQLRDVRIGEAGALCRPGRTEENGEGVSEGVDSPPFVKRRSRQEPRTGWHRRACSGAASQ